MPRGRKKEKGRTLEQQIKELDAKIESSEHEIEKAKEKKKDLLKQKKKQDVDSLYSAIQKSGMSVDDVLKLLEKNEKQVPVEPESEKKTDTGKKI